jgi:hypothetical protein
MLNRSEWYIDNLIRFWSHFRLGNHLGMNSGTVGIPGRLNIRQVV